MTLTEKVSNLIINSNMPITQLAKKTNLSRAYLYRIINNEIFSISFENAKLICESLNTEINTFLIGASVSDEKGTGVKIPVLGVIPAGVPISAIEEVFDYEEISSTMSSLGEYFALKVQGNSMLPDIKENDILIVRKQSDANNGDTCVIMVNGDDATVKKIKKDTNGIMLVPNNPEFEPMFYTNIQIEKLPIKIIGKVIECRRSF